MPEIVIETGADRGRRISLDNQELVIFGRDPNCQVSFQDPLASRWHFAIENQHSGLLLVDQQSRNGTFVNGRLVDIAELKDGDEILAGQTRFTFFAGERKTEPTDLTGAEIGGYRIEKRLGRGGMGTVFLAVQLSMKRKVALKVLAENFANDPKHVDRFLSEARAAGQLNHPNVVQVYDVGQDKGFYFYSMEYLEGGSLGDILNYTDRLLPSAAIGLLKDVLRGLEYAEKHGIVHRDIKPENLMLDASGHAKIGDLGIALRLDRDSAIQRAGWGTPQYMAPEQTTGGRLDHRVDIYALGCTFYYLLSGQFPFMGATPAEILKRQREYIPRPVHLLVPEVPEPLSRIIERMMAKRPDDRYQNARKVLDALEELETRPSTRTGFPQDEASAETLLDLVQREAQRRSLSDRIQLPSESSVSVAGLRVLVVDDELPVRQLIAEYCRLTKCEVTDAASAEEAVEKFRQGDFDLVITDRIMPGKSGDELAVAVKAISPETPVVMLTAMGMRMRATGEQPECVDLVLSKPISRKRLIRAVQTVMPQE